MLTLLKRNELIWRRGEENDRRKETKKEAEGARKISVFFTSRWLSVPVITTEAIAIPWITKIYCNGRARLFSTLLAVVRSSLPSLRKNWGRETKEHISHNLRRDATSSNRRDPANKCIINALKRGSTMHDCVYSHAIYLRSARAVARKLPQFQKYAQTIFLFK